MWQPYNEHRTDIWLMPFAVNVNRTNCFLPQYLRLTSWLVQVNGIRCLNITTILGHLQWTHLHRDRSRSHSLPLGAASLAKDDEIAALLLNGKHHAGFQLTQAILEPQCPASSVRRPCTMLFFLSRPICSSLYNVGVYTSSCTRAYYFNARTSVANIVQCLHCWNIMLAQLIELAKTAVVTCLHGDCVNWPSSLSAFWANSDTLLFLASTSSYPQYPFSLSPPLCVFTYTSHALNRTTHLA